MKVFPKDRGRFSVLTIKDTEPSPVLVLDLLQNVEEIEKTVHKKHIFTHIRWNMTGIYITLRKEDPAYQWFGKDTPALPTAFRQFLG